LDKESAFSFESNRSGLQQQGEDSPQVPTEVEPSHCCAATKGTGGAGRQKGNRCSKTMKTSWAWAVDGDVHLFVHVCPYIFVCKYTEFVCKVADHMLSYVDILKLFKSILASLSI